MAVTLRAWGKVSGESNCRSAQLIAVGLPLPGNGALRPDLGQGNGRPIAATTLNTVGSQRIPSPGFFNRNCFDLWGCGFRAMLELGLEASLHP